MSLFWFKKQAQRPFHHGRLPRQQHHHSLRPFLEQLEDRTAPSTNTWTGAADHATWNLAGNWTGGVPVPGQDVLIPGTNVNGTTAVTLTGASANVDSLTSALPVKLQGTFLILTGGGTPATGGLTLTSSAAVIVTGGGVIDFNTATNQTLGGDGTGAVVFGDANSFNEITDSSGVQLTVAPGFSIHGTTGHLVGPGTFLNNGTIEAQNGGTILINTALSGTGILQAGDGTTAGTVNVSTSFISGNTLTTLSGGTILAGNSTLDSVTISSGSTVTVQGGTTTLLQNTITNKGTIEATGGGQVSFAAVVGNVGGTILSTGSGSVANLNGADIIGGTLTTSSGGTMFSGGSAIDDVTVSSGSTITAEDGTTTVLAHTITNNGTILEVSFSATTDIAIFGNVTLQGGGTLTMDNISLSNLVTCRIDSPFGAFTLTNVDNTIQGAGQIGAGTQLTLVNEAKGTIDANRSKTLTINPSFFVINSGVIDASGGGQLALDAPVSNAFGTILSTGSGSVAKLGGSEINDGFLTTSSGGTMFLGGSALTGVTISSGTTVIAEDGTTTFLVGTITNNGTILEDSTGDVTTIEITGNFTLRGGGTLTMSNFVTNRIISEATLTGGATLTNVDNTIQGAGQIGAGTQLTLVNEDFGIIDANQSFPLFIKPTADVTNNGVIEATGGSQLYLFAFTSFGFFISTDSGSVIDLRGSEILDGSLTTQSGGTMFIGASTLSNVFITLGSTVIAEDGTTTILAGTITNNGTIALNSTGDATGIQISRNVTLTGGGTLTMSNFLTNRIFASGGAATLTNVDNTIQGAGQIGEASLTLVNQAKGTIDANLFHSLRIDPGGGVTNTGLIEASAGGALSLVAVVDNSGGTIVSTGFGSFANLSKEIFGGTLTTSSSGTMFIGESIIDGVTISAGSTVIVEDGTTTILANAITNNGTIALNSTGRITKIGISDVTLTGGGTLTMSNFPTNLIYADFISATLTNVDNTIQGAGQISDGYLTLVNEANGTIDANQSNLLFIDPSAGVTNNGTFQVKSHSGLFVHGSTTNFTNYNPTTSTLTGGTYIVAGTFEFDGANIATNAANITLDGPSSAIVDESFANGIRNFTTNAAAGSFTIKDGRSFVTNPSAGTFTNAGAMTIDGSGGSNTFDASGAYTQTGGSTTLVSDGTATLASETRTININGGKLEGTGAVRGNVTVETTSVKGGGAAAILSPGTSTAAGQIAISGSLTMGTGSILNEKLTGPNTTTPAGGTDYDQVSAGGAVTLTNCTLSGSRFTGYLPAAGSAFEIIDNTGAAAVSGAFSGLAEGSTVTIGGFQFSITYQGGDGNDVVLTTLTVTITPAIVTAVSVDWGTQTSAVQDASGGRLLPTGRTNDMPWVNVSAVTITLSKAAALGLGDVTATGLTTPNYGPVAITGGGTSYTITLSQPISKADRVTIAIGNAGITTFTRRLDVLPGDVNDSGAVTGSDGVLILTNFTPAHPYSAFRDMNGDGSVNMGDFTAFRPYLSTTLPPAAPQLAAGGEGPGAATRLSQDQLAAVLQEAISRWAAAGISARDVALLHGVTARVTNLPAGYLGYAPIGGVTISLSADAAGYGWTTSPAPGREDLVTVVMHELGHVLGLDDLSPALYPNDLMAETLPAGVGRLPSALDMAAVTLVHAVKSVPSTGGHQGTLPFGLPANIGALVEAAFSSPGTLAEGTPIIMPLGTNQATGPGMHGLLTPPHGPVKNSSNLDLAHGGSSGKGDTQPEPFWNVFGDK